MKKIIVLIVIVIAILIALKIFSIGTPVSVRPLSPKAEGLSFYEMIKQDGTHDGIVGVRLPDSASEVHGHQGFLKVKDEPEDDRLTKCSWVVAALPRSDFYDLVEQLGLEKRRDLLKFWPLALECTAVDDFKVLWKVGNNVNNDTYYREEPTEETRRVFKYENGKFYVKKETRYRIFKDESGEERYIKLKKGK